MSNTCTCILFLNVLKFVDRTEPIFVFIITCQIVLSFMQRMTTDILFEKKNYFQRQ